MESLRDLLDRCARLLVTLGAVLVGLMALHVVLDVGGRYIFNFPLPGTVELVSHYYMVAVIFGPLAYVQSNNGHFAADLLTQVLPPGLRRALALAGLCVTALLLLFLAWRTGAYALEFTEARESVQTAYFPIPTWPSRWFVPLGLGLMALYCLLQSAYAFVGRSHSTTEDAA